MNKVLMIWFLFIHIILSSVGEPFKVISLLEICEPSDTTNKHRLPLDNTTLSIHYGILHGLNENYKENVDYNYEMYDICNDTNRLVKILLRLIVDLEYESATRIGGDTEFTSNILCIFMSLSESRSILAANILSSVPVPVISFQNFSKGNQIYNEYFLEASEMRKETNEYLLEFIQRHRYDYLVVFSLNESHGTHGRYRNFVEVARSELCMVYQTASWEEAYRMSLQVEDKKAHAFIVFGNVDSVTFFTYFVTKELNEGTPLIYPIFEIEGSGPLHSNATKSLLDLLKLKKMTNHAGIELGKYKNSHTLINFEVKFGEIKSVAATKSRKKLKPSDVLGIFNTFSYINRTGKSTCTDFKCRPGYEKILSKVPNTLWKNRYIYECVQCPTNYVKTSYSGKQCVRCVNKNISNSDHTHCFVPYKLVRFDFITLGNFIGFIVNIAGLLFSILIIVLFEMYKKTPIVRASDRILSQIQNASSFLLFLLLLVQALLLPTNTSCVLLPCFIGFTFSTIVTVTLAKVEKPLLVFRQRKQLTQRDINQTIAQQFLMIILIPLTSVLLGIVQYRSEPCRAKWTYNDTTVEKSMSCSNSGHLHIQIVFIILLSLFTLIQAFRSRKLPDNYSESMTILYSSFSAAVFLSILFPLYHFQTSDAARVNVQWILLSSVALILMTALYAPKLYTMVFYPEKNTMRAWNRRRIQYSMDESTTYHTVPMTIVDSL